MAVIGCGSAAAQSAGRLDPRVETAYTNWRRLSQTEVDCVDRALQAQRSSLRTVIQRGIGPSDSAMTQLRTTCRTQARTASQPRPNGTQALAAVGVDRIDEPGSNAAERRAAERAAEKALADKVAAEIAATKKAAAEKAAAEKIVAQKAAEKAETERAAAELAASKTAAEERLAAERLATQRAAEQAEAERTAAEQAVATKAAADKIAADNNARRPAETPDAARQRAEPARPSSEDADPQSPGERPHHETIRIPAEAAYAYAAAQSRISFVYGMLSGPLVFCLGGVVFMLLGRRRNASAENPAELALQGVEQSTAADRPVNGDRPDIDRLVAAMMVEIDRRRMRQPDPVH